LREAARNLPAGQREALLKTLGGSDAPI
jgi:hypothetical protein